MDQPLGEKSVSQPVRALYALAAAVGYPPAFLAAYFLTMAVPYGTTPRGTNTVALVLPVFALLAAAVFLARYQLWRVLARRYRPRITDAWGAFLLAHRPCLYVVPATAGIAVMDMEGNVFGLMIFPLLLVLSLLLGILVQRRLWRKNQVAAGATQ